MALQINWTDKALDHLGNILNYWEERNGSRTYSNKLYSIFQEALEILSRYPDSGRQTNNLFLKKKSVRDYFIYYTFDDSSLTVIGISYMGRGPKYLKSMEE
ncbi:MAG: type II toxin-antitoxin system RelE/ParE family toxin [Saprospiraceae bacterium]|nr:type II toxin-antitoxin system RelE/ParE family toxin [Saprospiraceae bacterium]